MDGFEDRDALHHPAAERRARAPEDVALEAAVGGRAGPVERREPAQRAHRPQPLAATQRRREHDLLRHVRAAVRAPQRPAARDAQPGEDAQQARLAAAVGAGDVHRLARAQRQADARQDGSPPAADRHVVGLDHDH
jgi:hypothetical protein